MAASSRGKRRSFYADLDHLRGLFENLDSEKTGFIGYNELTKLVQSMPNTEDSVVPELMDKLDRDKDGKVRNTCVSLALYNVNKCGGCSC